MATSDVSCFTAIATGSLSYSAASVQRPDHLPPAVGTGDAEAMLGREVPDAGARSAERALP